MINFSKISYKNILSVGNKPIEIVFDQHKKTLITGTNGCGKSTLIEALAFVLYGKPFRKINKGSLVNSINKKGLVVDVDLTVKGDEYKVVRSIKPNSFVISKNGVELAQHGSSADYQEFLEETVLKMSFITFKQIIVLGTAGFEPFMDLDPTKRRAIVEDLVDVGIFTKMSDINKLTIRDLKTKLQIDTSSLESLAKILEVQEKNSTSIIESNQERLVTLNERFKDASSNGKHYGEELKTKMTSLADVDAANGVVLSTMFDVMSVKLSELDKSTAVTDLRDSHTVLINDFTAEASASYTEFRKTLDSDIESLKALHQSNVAAITETLYPIPDTEPKVKIINSSKADIELQTSTIAANDKRLQFFEHTVECPTCESSLDNEYRDKMSAVLIETSDVSKKRLVKLKLIIEKCNNFITTENEKRSLSLADVAKREKDDNEVLSTSLQKITDVKQKRESDDSKSIAEFTRNLTDELADYKVKVNSAMSTYQLSAQNEMTKVKDSHSESTQLDRDEIQTLRSNATSALQNAKSIRGDITSLESEQERLRSNTGDVDKAKNDIVECETSIKTTTLELKNLAILQTLLKDDGIKAKVIKQYIPFINSSINGYLKTMGSKINFTLDEQFNEKIKSRGREEFTYNSFSQGEKMRIDVAIMFTWRDVIRKRTNFLSNLLIMDEVMDGASDDAGIKSLHQLIDNLDDNVIIISHNETHDLDKFDKHLSMCKKGNFTYKVEN